METQKKTSAVTAALLVALIAAGAVALGSCGGPQDKEAARAQRAREAAGDILIGAAWPWKAYGAGDYWEGMKLALDEVNAAGGVLGRPLRIIKADDGASITGGRLVAQQFADNLDVVAVIGHLNSYVSIPAAAIYEAAGLLMLTPASTSPRLTQQEYRLVFRSVNSDREIGRQLAAYARHEGYRQVAICYVRNAYGEGLADAFERQASRVGLEVVDRQSYDQFASLGPHNFGPMLEKWKDRDFDAIFLAGMAPEAGYFIKKARALGMAVPIFGGDALAIPSLIETAGEAAEGVVVVSVFHPDNPRPAVQRFNAAFEAAYDRRPDSWAARGYEAVHLLAAAMEQAGSTVPAEVANALRSPTASWSSMAGSFSFNERGDVLGKPTVLLTVRDGGFAFLKEMHPQKRTGLAVKIDS